MDSELWEVLSSNDEVAKDAYLFKITNDIQIPKIAPRLCSRYGVEPLRSIRTTKTDRRLRLLEKQFEDEEEARLRIRNFLCVCFFYVAIPYVIIWSIWIFLVRH